MLKLVLTYNSVSSKKKLKALAGNWILGLFAVDVDENESMILDSSRVYSMNSSMDVVKVSCLSGRISVG